VVVLSQPPGHGETGDAGHDGRRCELCGESLDDRRSDARYCSGAHRAEASRRRREGQRDGVEPPQWFWSGWWGGRALLSAQRRTDDARRSRKSSREDVNDTRAGDSQYRAWLDSPTLTTAERAGLRAAHQLVLAGEAVWIDEDDSQDGTEVVWDFTGGHP
jgi:hypothetical protein